jgi:hypothetical protein
MTVGRPRPPLLLLGLAASACSFDPSAPAGDAGGFIDGAELDDGALPGDAGTPNLEPGDGRLFFPGPTGLLSLRWNGAGWQTTGVPATGVGTIRWLSSRVHPGGDEVLAVVSTAMSETVTLVRLIHPNEGAIDGLVQQTVATLEDPARATRQIADVAFEDSGDSLTVYGTLENEVLYRARAAGAGFWPAPQAVPGLELPAPVAWVKLESRPGFDEIGLAFVDQGGGLGAAIWDGAAWIDVEYHPLVAGAAPFRSFDLAWESEAGRLLLAWGAPTPAEIHYRVWDSTSGWGTTAPVLFTGNVHHLELASDPDGDRIALAVTDTVALPAGLFAAIWNGEAWVSARALTGYAGTEPASFGAGLAWLGGALILAHASDTAGALGWSAWDPSSGGDGWTVHSPVIVPGLRTIESIRLGAAMGGSQALAVFFDQAGELFSAAGDGTSFVVYDANPLSSSVTSRRTVPFALAVRPGDP